MRLTRKKPAELIGYALTMISLVFIALILADSDIGEQHFSHPALSLALVVMFGMVASVSVVINAYAWKLILEFVNGAPVSTGDVLRVYLKANIAKYLPGNVMHYAGRNYLGSRLGWKNAEMAFSSVLEYGFGLGLTGLIIVIFYVAGLVSLPPDVTLAINTHNLVKFAAIAVVAVLAVLIATLGYRCLVKREHPLATAELIYSYLGSLVSVGFLKLFIKMFFITLGGFLINCLFYFYLCDLILDFQIHPGDIFNANAALSIANYTSILTPGVPGGIGVRESVSTLLLSAYGYPKELLVVSLLVFRVTCVLGDVIPFFMLKLFPK